MKEFIRNEKDNKAPLASILEIRKRARRNIEDGALTQGYRGDRATVLRLLNESLASEIVCVLRYKRHYYMASGIHAQTAAAEFLEHAVTEQQHADQIAERIVQLGGEPDLNPDTLSLRSHAEYVEGSTVEHMLRENLVAERIAIESYTEFIRYLGDSDPTTRRLMENILATEEEHADDIKTLLDRFGRRSGRMKIGIKGILVLLAAGIGIWCLKREWRSSDRDIVEEASADSFPASDPPSWNAR